MIQACVPSLLWLRSWWRAWLFCLVPPLPVVLLWHEPAGRFIALCLFFTSSITLVVQVFGDDLAEPATSATELVNADTAWRTRMVGATLLLLSHWIIFSVLCLGFNDARDVMAPVLALASLVPSLSIAPCLVLVTRKLFASVVLTLFLVGSMKIIGCIIVVLIYGWDADAQGRTTLPWTHPNLLVCLFLLNTGLMSLTLGAWGRTRFIREWTGLRPNPISI